MKLRKKILLAGCGILFVIALFQCVASSNNSIKTLKLEKDYNEITIQNSTETIVLQKQADQNWTVSKNQYAVNDAEFDSILDALQNLQLLEKVATASSDDVKEKYDLIEGKVITVTVKNVKVSAGAGFIVVLTGDILTMPGLPKSPAAERIDVDAEGKITGLF